MTLWHNEAGGGHGRHLAVECSQIRCGHDPAEAPVPPPGEQEIREDERQKIAALLRRAADGRREYAASWPEPGEAGTAPGGDARLLLEQCARSYESAAAIAEDPYAVMRVIPSWRWTDGERDRLNQPGLMEKKES